MKAKTIPLRECSIAYFLKSLIMEIGLIDLSDNKFCQIFENHPKWLSVFFGQNSSFNPPPIKLIEPNAFCELAIKNEWMWKIIDLAQSNGNKLSFDQSQTVFMPKVYFQDQSNDPNGNFLKAIDVYLWFATAVRDCQLSVELNENSFRRPHAVYRIETEVSDPLADVDATDFSLRLSQAFNDTMNWQKTLEKLQVDHPALSIVRLREWVRCNLFLLGEIQADQIRPLFGLVPRMAVQINPIMWIDGKPPEIPSTPVDIPNRGQVKHPSGLILTQPTMDAILLYCFEMKKSEDQVFGEMYDPKKIDTISQEIGIGQAIYLLLVKYHRGTIIHAVHV